MQAAADQGEEAGSSAVDRAFVAEPGGLPAFRWYRPRAGHPDWPRLQAEAHTLAERLLPSLERPRRGPAEWRRRAASYRTALDNYRINRRLHRQGREDLRPLYFIWTTLRTCNFRCTYCDDHQGHKYPDLPHAGVLDTAQGLALLRVMRTRAPSVYFAGGEPTMRRDLPELVRAARDLDYYPIIVNSNGSLFHRLLERPAWRTLLADVDGVVVSLDALDLALLRDMWVTRRPEDVLRNLLLLRELAGPLRLNLMVNTVIQPGLVAEAGAVLDLANDLGIGFCPVPVNVGPRIHPDLPRDPEYQALVARILARQRAGYPIVGSARMNERLLRSAPLRCRNTLKPHIDYDGRLAWPCKASVNVPPAWVEVLGFDHLDDVYRHASGRIDPNGFHGPGAEQCGGDCNWAQNYTTDAYVHGLEHPLSLLREVAGFLRHRPRPVARPA